MLSVRQRYLGLPDNVLPYIFFFVSSYNLIKKAIKGNFNAYSILVNELKSDGYKLAYTILKNEQDSIDAYLQAVEKGLKNI